MKLTKSLLVTLVRKCKRVYVDPQFEVGTVSATVDSDNGVQTVTIAGSENLFNWLSNLYFLKVKRSWYKGKAHKGFVGCFEKIRSHIMERLVKDEPVLITGHSLGGAMGILLACYLKYCGYTVKGVVTFGKPRVADKVFKLFYHALNIPTYRVVNKRDGVVTVPKINFYHEGQSVVIADNKITTYDEARGVTDFLLSPFGFGFDHKIDAYVKSITSLRMS